MNNNICVLALLGAISLPVGVQAGLQPLDDDALSNKSGQAILYDADRPSIVFALESRYNLESDLTKICDPNEGDVACNIGIALNNRYEGSDPETAPKQWLVFKNVTGSLVVPELKYSGQDIDVGEKGSPDIRASVALTLNYNDKPATRGAADVQWISLNTLGFESLAVESDTEVEINADGSLNTNNLPGYRNPALASAPAGGFDDGKYRGFLGIDTTANIGINGTAKLFSCTDSFRC